MEVNKIYRQDCVEGMRSLLPDECADLIIADPPHFKAAGKKWDNLWETEADYLEWSRKWISEASRSLRRGGSFYLFGYFRILSLLLPILEDCGLALRQQLIIHRDARAVFGNAAKMFPNATESILFLWKDPKPFAKEFLKNRQKELGLSAKEINERLGVKSNGGGMWSIYTGENICNQLPTEALWRKLQDILQFDIPYEKIGQTYHPQLEITDVWEDISFYGEERYHPTQKPQKAIERLILTSSNEGDLVLDPFMGGGSTAVACVANSRNYIGFEIEQTYYNKSLERLAYRQLSFL